MIESIGIGAVAFITATLLRAGEDKPLGRSALGLPMVLGGIIGLVTYLWIGH